MASQREARLTWNGSNLAMAEHDAAVEKARNARPDVVTTIEKTQKPKQRKWKRPKYRDYMNSGLWRRKRKKALEHYGAVCSCCKSTDNLQVHHVSYRRLGRERMSDLRVLCDRCHRIEHESNPTVTLTDPLSRQFQNMVANM